MFTGMMSSAFKKIKQSQNPNIGGGFAGMNGFQYAPLLNHLNRQQMVQQPVSMIPQQASQPVSMIPQQPAPQQQVQQTPYMQPQYPDQQGMQQQPAMSQPILPQQSNYKPMWQEMINRRMTGFGQGMNSNPYGMNDYFSSVNQFQDFRRSPQFFNYRY